MPNQSLHLVEDATQGPDMTDPILGAVLGPSKLEGERYAWQRLSKTLQEQPDLAALCRILNGHEVKAKGLSSQLRDFYAREIKDALRIVRLAKMALRSLDPDVIDHAVEDVAIVICEGAEGENPLWTDQSAVQQARHLRHARTCVNAYQYVLEGRATGDLR